MQTGIIADIQRSSIHDGPGIRTTVFFKGCPLHCPWCHNPETVDPNPQILHYPQKCIGCGMCDKGCFSGAKVVCGKEMSSDQVMREILLDSHYYSKGGGVTFSGGEPFMQADFLSELIDKCKDKNIHTAVETSLCIYNESVLKKSDLIMCDMKIWDNMLHKEHVGIESDVIKENIQKTDKLNIPIIIRTPVIEEINQEIEKISEFSRSMKNVIQYELLPYHPLGLEKAKAMGTEQKTFKIPGKEYMEEMKKYAYIR